MPLSGRGGARATLGRKQSIPPPRSAPAENYVPRTSRGELTSSGGSRSTWLKDVAGGVRLSWKELLPRRSAMLILAIDLGKAKSLACWYQADDATQQESRTVPTRPDD